MDEMGFQISLSDYRLLFDQIDFDQAGEMDYFKFCLLDFDKHELRQKLIRDYQLSLVRKNQQDKSVYHKNNEDLNPQEDLTLFPKNKEMIRFLSSVAH